MPRSQAGCPPRGGGRSKKSKDFGFDAAHLIRIFLAADPEQLLIAIETFGFRLPDHAPIESLGDLIVELHGEAAEAIGEFVVLVGAAVDFALEELFEMGLETVHQVRSDRALSQLKTRVTELRLDLAKKRSKIENVVAQAKTNLFPFNLPEFD